MTQANRRSHGTVMMGGLPIAAVTRLETASAFARAARAPRGAGTRPLYSTSVNGEVLSRAERSGALRASIAAADMIHADGQAMVTASRWAGGLALPERVATTDLFHDVAALAEREGLSFYLLGGTEAVMAEAAQRVRAAYPGLRIVGARHGYVTPAEEEGLVAEINAAAPDILWIGMGVPLEQRFALRVRDRLHGVGVIKTTGGLFDFLSGRRSRAPRAMQAAGLEWLYRLALEPRRLGMRYLTTNPHAAAILLRDVLAGRLARQAQALLPKRGGGAVVTAGRRRLNEAALREVPPVLH